MELAGKLVHTRPCSASMFPGPKDTENRIWLHRQGYGSYPHNPPVLVKGLDHALVYNFAGDNGGPQSVLAYQGLWRALEKHFPNAEIVASTFDNYTDTLQTIRHTLPKLSKEIGDTYNTPANSRLLPYFTVCFPFFRHANEILKHASFLRRWVCEKSRQHPRC